MKRRIEEVLERSLATAVSAGALSSEAAASGTLEVPKERSHGDLASNVALTMAKSERRAPRAIAETILEHLEDHEGWIASSDVAGPGCLTFRLSADFGHRELTDYSARGDLGAEDAGRGETVPGGVV